MDLGGVAVVVGAVLGAGGMGALVQARSINRRTSAQAHSFDADAQATLGGGWQVLVREQRQELNELRERLVGVEHREHTCQERLAAVEQREHVCQERLAALEQLNGGRTPADVERTVVGLIDREIERRERTDEH